MVQLLWRTVWRFLKKQNIEPPYHPAIPLLAVYPEKTKTLIRKDTHTPMFITALFTVAKTWKQTECPSTDEWIKSWYIHIMENYSAIKMDEILPFAAMCLYLENVMLNEIGQTEKDKDCMIYVESKK